MPLYFYFYIVKVDNNIPAQKSRASVLCLQTDCKRAEGHEQRNSTDHGDHDRAGPCVCLGLTDRPLRTLNQL